MSSPTLQITSALNHINLLKSWRHSGFQVFGGPRIHSRKKEAMAYASERKPGPLYHPGLFLPVTRKSLFLKKRNSSNRNRYIRIPSFLSMEKFPIRISGFPRIIRPFEVRENQDA